MKVCSLLLLFCMQSFCILGDVIFGSTDNIDKITALQQLNEYQKSLAKMLADNPLQNSFNVVGKTYSRDTIEKAILECSKRADRLSQELVANDRSPQTTLPRPEVPANPRQVTAAKQSRGIPDVEMAASVAPSGTSPSGIAARTADQTTPVKLTDVNSKPVRQLSAADVFTDPVVEEKNINYARVFAKAGQAAAAGALAVLVIGLMQWIVKKLKSGRSERMEQHPGMETENHRIYAGFGKRFVAALIDILVTTLLGALSGGFLGFIYSVVLQISYGSTGTMAGARIVGQIAGVVSGWLYFAFFESSSKQATLGKMALGIKVTDLNGKPIGFWTATVRHFGKILSTLILFIGFIMIVFTRQKQGLHDMMAGCLVVNKWSANGA